MTTDDNTVKLLPFEARMSLVRAAQAPGGLMARTVAIARATALVRRSYPEFFTPVAVVEAE